MRLNFKLISLLIIFSSALKAQNTEGVYPSQVFQQSRTMAWALKYESNTISRDNDYFFNRYALSSEFKLAKHLSINFTGRFFRQSRLLFQENLNENEKKPAWQSEFSIEPRWHPANYENAFIGNYIGLRLIQETGFRRPEPTYKMLLTFGNQQFFHTSMFNNIDNAFDGNLGLGFSYDKKRGIKPAFQIQLLQGAILNDLFRKYKPDNAPPDRKDEYQAMIVQNHLIKFDLFNLITKADENDLVGEIRLGYEQKVAKSAFSVNIEGMFSPYRFKNSEILRGGDVVKSTGRRFGFSLEPRWYYDLNKRIKKGVSGNNLLGSYVSFEFLYQNKRVNKTFLNNANSVFHVKSLTFTPLWGVQQQFSKRIFYDFKLGWGIRTVEEGKRFYFTNFQSNIFADILIGLKL